MASPKAAAPAGDGGMNLLLFQQQIVEELLEEDGLAVLARGLGMHTAIAALLAVHQMTAGSGGVVVVIGAERQPCGVWLGCAQHAPPTQRGEATLLYSSLRTQERARCSGR